MRGLIQGIEKAYPLEVLLVEALYHLSIREVVVMEEAMEEAVAIARPASPRQDRPTPGLLLPQPAGDWEEDVNAKGPTRSLPFPLEIPVTQVQAGPRRDPSLPNAIPVALAPPLEAPAPNVQEEEGAALPPRPNPRDGDVTNQGKSHASIPVATIQLEEGEESETANS